MFSLRIVSTSHYQAKPIPGLDTTHSEFRNTAVRRVPVLRIFGSTPGGQKTCMHVHGVFPYLYVPYDGTQPVDRYLRQFAASLDKALNVANRSTDSSAQHVYKISLVSGIPMYGYHAEEQNFLKIYLFNPNNVRKTADLLLGGAIMNKPFQPHESHIPYTLQLFIDHNLYGMNLINVAALKFRKKAKGGKSDKKDIENVDTPQGGNSKTLDKSLLGESSSACISLSSKSSSPVDLIWHEENIPSELWLSDSIERQSTCELEVDVVAADITNRHELESNIGANPGLVALKEDEKQRRRDAGESSQLEPDSSQERLGVQPSESEKELLSRFLDIVRQQQVFRNSQPENSLSSQPASQVESHVSRSDSTTSSQNTAFLDDSDNNEDGDAEEDGEHPPIVNINSIERVVSCSQSFSLRSSQNDVSDTKDQSVANILAALLEESGPPPSQLVSLEDQDSILNQSVILDKEAEEDEEKENHLMSQIIDKEDSNGTEAGLAELENTWDSDKDTDVVMNTDDDGDDISDEVELLPQFDGASDKMSGSYKKTDQSQIPNINQSVGTVQVPGADTAVNQVSDTSTVSRTDVNWKAGTTGRAVGSSQSFPNQGGSGSWTQQSWPQQSGPGGNSWHGQSPTWSQQQQYHNWSQHPHLVTPSAFPSQQAPFQSPPTVTSFQSPPQNPYASPTHQQVYQTPSPSASHHQYQYPPYQSPTSNQTYQQPYQSPSQHSYQSPGSSQSYHSSPSSQPYQSPSTSQPYSPLGATSQPYQLPASSKSYLSQSGNQPYQSPQGNTGYQSSSGQMFHSPYSPSQPHQSPPQQPYPPPYQSPVHGGHYPPQSSWGLQGYPGFYQGHAGSSMKHSGGSLQPLQPDSSFGQLGNISPGSSGRYQSQDIQQQISAGLQTDVNISNKPPVSHMTGSAEQHNQLSDMSQPRKKKGGRKKKDCTKSGGFKPHQPPCLSPTPVVLKSPFELGQQNPLLNSSVLSNIGTPPLASGVSFSQSKSQDDNISPHAKAEDSSKSQVISDNKSSESTLITKISTLEFKRNVAPYSVAPVNITVSSMNRMEIPLNTDKASTMAAEKVEMSTSTPMIQQLLMEEPARMNIRKEDREAVMKKPVANTTLPKPRKKYTRRIDQGVRKPGRPRSMSLSSPALPTLGFCGYSPPAMNLPRTGQQDKSHTMSHPFSCQPRMSSSIENYAWQQQQHCLPGSMWQQQQQQQWGMHEWQGYNNPGEISSSEEMGSSCGPMTSRLQQRSQSADTVQLPVYQTSCQSEQTSPFTVSQIALENNSVGTDQASVNRENIDKSSLSSLFQLVSDVGSEDLDWESASTTVVPNLFPNNIESETPKSTPPSDVNHGSPKVKDFITLESPLKQGFEKANSDTTGMISSEESDGTDLDLSCDLKPRTLSSSHSLGSSHPGLGKQSRLKKLGLLHTESTDLDSVSGPIESNPAYTYTFHVPTPVFKKLKFFRNVESRKHNIKVVRMHPMDARRYSLLKIGREIVKAVKLTEADLAKHSISLPSPFHFVSSDGSTNRVNLDIPVVSVDRRSGDSGSEESSLSKFDTDFPPNKVAPPSSFHASQVSASLTRTTSTATRGSPISSDWVRQYTGQQTANYNGRFSPGSLQRTYSPQQKGHSPQRRTFPFAHHQRDVSLNTFSGHQQITQSNMNRHLSSQPSENSSGLTFQQFNQKGNNFYPQLTPSSTHPQENMYLNQQDMYINHTSYQQQQPFYHHQQQHQHQTQQQSQEQQSQTSYTCSNQEPKNGLRSPGQHGLMSKIESGRENIHSGDQESEHDMNTAETSPFNTRVNAQRRDNHAGHMDNQSARQNADVCTIVHLPVLEHTHLPNHSYNKDDSNCLGINMNHSNSFNCSDEQCDMCTGKTGQLTLKRSGDFHCHSLADVDNCSHVIDKDCMEQGNVITKDIKQMDALQSCISVISAKSLHFTKLKHNDTEEDVMRRERTSWRKNVKALRLAIPVPQSNQNPLDIDGTHDSLDYTEKEAPASSQRASDDGNCSESRNISHSSRSVRSTSLEEGITFFGGGRQSPRQAKLRSFYSKSPFNQKPKKKRRKRQGPLIEGVHYIVIGKFRGYQSMLVKINKLNLNTAERVGAGLFEKLAAKEIVRVVSPVSCPDDEVCGMESEPLDYYSSTTEDHSDAETNQAEFGIVQHVASTSQTYHRPSRGRPLRHAKFRSALASSLKRLESLKDMPVSIPLENEVESKNLLTGPISRRIHDGSTSGANGNNDHCSYFVQDKFFFRFKENFIRHNKAKVATVNSTAECHEDTFFKNVRASSFQHFQQIFLANVKKLKSNVYSSSSDDEDDVLEETILKEQIGIPHTLLSCLARGIFTSYETLKHAPSKIQSDFSIVQPVNPHPMMDNGNADDILSQFSAEEESQLDKLKGSEGINEQLMECTSSSTKDATSSSDDERTLSPDVDPQCCLDEKGKCEESAAALNRRHSVSEASNMPCEQVSIQEINNTCSSLETKKEEVNRHLNSSFANTTSVMNSNGIIHVEEKEDYLKSQMAFFEDITSDSDSYDTIIMDSSVGREDISQGDPPSFASQSALSSSGADKCVLSTPNINIHSGENVPRSESVTRKDAMSEDTCPVFSDIHPSELPIEHTEMSCSDFKCDRADLSGDASSNHKKPQIDLNEDVTSQSFETSTSQLSEFPALECSVQTKDSCSNLTDQIKSVLDESDDATIDIVFDALSKDSNQNGSEQHHSSKTSDPNESIVMDMSIDSDNDLDTSISADTSSRQKKHGKGMKKSKRDKGSKLVNRRQLMDDINSSSNDEMNTASENYDSGQNKCLRQRKHTLYTYYSDILDSTEDDSDDSSDEDFNGHVSRRKGSKNNQKQKGVGFKDKQFKQIHQTSVAQGKATKSGLKTHLSRGKKKKPPGGDKLLNSLSLLHMATLANLTEIQSEHLNDLPMSMMRPENEHNMLQYSDMTSNDYNSTFTPSLEHMSFISPQNSGEIVGSPPVTCSPSDKKRLKQTRGGAYIGEDIAIPRRLLNSPRLAILKPGCNGASNLGSKPLPFSRLMNNSASPVPSNFSFNHISDSSMQPEPSNINEDAGTSNTLQLLETRRAQVNCASFSMKDILRLTTTDDSMDSDSKDSAALIRPPEPKRAQVKSTSLSMNDILKLTGADKNAETENSETSHPIFSLLSNPDPYNTQPSQNNKEITDVQVSHHISQERILASNVTPEKTASFKSNSQAQEEIANLSNTLLTQVAAICNSDSPTEIETSDASESLLSQLASFNRFVTQKPDKCTDELLQPENSKKRVSHSRKSDKNIGKRSEKTASDINVDKTDEKTVSDKNMDKTYEKMASDINIDKTDEKITSDINIDKTDEKMASDVNIDKTNEKTVSEININVTNERKIKIKLTLVPRRDSLTVNCSDDSDIDSTEGKKSEKVKKYTGNMREKLNSKGKDLSQYSLTNTSSQVTPDLPATCIQKLLTSQGGKLTTDHKPLSPSLTVSSTVTENPTCRFPSPDSLSHLVLEIQSASQKTQQQKKLSDSDKQNDTDGLATTETAAISQHTAGSKDSLVDFVERSSKCDCISQDLSIEKFPQLNKHKMSTSSVLQIPRISVTCDETVMIDRLDGNYSEIQTGKASREKGDTTNENLLMKNVDIELKPLNPLQIPPYSFIGHGFGSQHGHIFHTSLNPSVYYPYCWQWPVHTPGSDPAVSPLNLCTIQKSPNTYSPITPTSPISPSYPSHTLGDTTSSMSPPLKKAKPLWYPWLTVDSARSRSEPKFRIAGQRDYKSRVNKPENKTIVKVPNVLLDTQNDMEQTTVPVISDKACNETWKDTLGPKNHTSRIVNLLTSSPQKSTSIKMKNDKLSNCQTVSQFLGSVIETAYEQGNYSISTGHTGSMTVSNLRLSSPKTSDTKHSVCRKTSEHHYVSTGVYNSRDTAMTGGSCNSSRNKNLNHKLCFKEGTWKCDAQIINNSHSEDTSCKSEHEQVRGSESEQSQFGLLSPVKSSSPDHVHRDIGLKDRLITKLIKGDGLEYYYQEPAEASRGKRQPNTGQKRSRGVSKTHNSQEQPLQKPDREKKNDETGDSFGNGKDKTIEKSPTHENFSDLTVRPVKPPPSRGCVEESLHVLGLSSVQPPVAFCSVHEDLPDRPVEQGGRVLKVESKRLCELSPFSTSQHIIGITIWRSHSLSSSKLLASQSQGRPLWERLEQEPQLRFLLAGERLVVASPVCTPPSRKSVTTWLQNKMANIREDESKQPALLSAKFTESCTAEDAKIDKEQSIFDEKSISEIAAQNSVLTSVTICKQMEEDKKYENTSEIVSSQTSASEGDSSAFVDTDLDISCTPTTTPAPLISSTQTSFLPLQTYLPTGDQESYLASETLVSIGKRKRKLFADDSDRDILEESSSKDSHTLVEDFSITNRSGSVETRTTKQKIPLSSTATNSTPMKHSFEGFHDPACTPINNSQENVNQSSPVMERKASGTVQKTADNPPVLRHVSTNMESLLRKTILTSQTQRQISALQLNEVSQIEGPTPKNSFGFKVAQTGMQDSKALHKYQHVTILSLELHVTTRGDLRPDPEFDAIQAVFFSVLNDIPPEKGKRNVTGVIVVDLESWNKVNERNKNEESLVDTSGTERSVHASIPHCARSKDPSVMTDQMSSDTSTITKSNISSQVASSTSYQVPTTSAASQHPSSSPASGEGKEHPVNSISADLLHEKCATEGLEVTYVKDEMDLINTFAELVTQYDPDFLVGFEIQMLSWGYLLQRAASLNVDLCSRLSRVQDAKNDNCFSAEKDEWGADHMSEIHVTGRIVLNLWRILRHEVTLNLYSFENVVYHVLHQRIPLYSFRSLTKWYNHKTHLHRWRVFEHYLFRVKGQLEVIDQLDLIGKTSEFARVFGIEFYDVLARGSQIRVESMMLRLAKPMNFVPLSPGVAQRARQRAPECIPLNLEPESKYYTSPVAVLDFQSLYPSIMIAYNYCFTTCLGRLDFLEKAHEGPIEFGCTSLNLTPATLKKIRDHVTVSPNGVVFLKSSVRRGVIPIMVEEILNTRLMVKKSMKSYKNDQVLTRMLDARQLGLKLIANVTYGYTGASYSGRMPCIEVGDSIVRKARESLERAIELVRNTPRWGAHVVYGDTDSMFIHFPGRTKDEAFVLGQEIADAVTAMFPSPMKLRFEKIYMPCVLQTKKRYVGFMYETQDQKEPVYDAKGIETVRRDACSAVSKILERSIKILFSTHDVSRVRIYVTRQLHKLLEGKVSIIDLIFAKEYRGLMGYKPGACVPALEIARRRLRLDRRSEPRVGERVPYIIVHGSPGLPLIQLVKEPSELVADTSLRLNGTYYISKQILPPLDRIFSLIGVSVFKWYLDMPKVVRVGPMMGTAPSNKQGTISQFFATSNCPVCDAQTKQLICQECGRNPQLVVFMLTTRIRDWEKAYCRLAQVCDTCQGIQDCEQVCVSIDCPIMFRRIIARQDLARADNLQEMLAKYLKF